MGVEGEGHEPIPRVIGPHLVLVEPDLLFALLEALLDRPALPRGRHHGVPPHRAEREHEVVGPLAGRGMPPDEQGVVPSGLLPRQGKQGPVIPPRALVDMTGLLSRGPFSRTCVVVGMG